LTADYRHTVIAVGFDGTIVQHRFPDIGPPVPGALHWLKRYEQAGAGIILWTLRTFSFLCDEDERYDTLAPAENYLRDNGLVPWGVNSDPLAWTLLDTKIQAHVYIDDKAFGCPLVHPIGEGRPYVDWSVVGPAVMRTIRDRQTSEPLLVDARCAYCRRDYVLIAGTVPPDEHDSDLKPGDLLCTMCAMEIEVEVVPFPGCGVRREADSD